MKISVALFLGASFRVAQSTCTESQQQDCDGNDITNVRGYSSSDCCQACSTTAGCGAYVFVSGGTYGNTCYLKSSCVPKGGCAGDLCTSGVVAPDPTPSPSPQPTPAPTPTPPSQCANTVGQDCDGEDLTSVKGYSTSDCCNACLTTPGCRAYVFVEGGSVANTCYLKSMCIPKGGCAGSTCTAGVHTGPPAPMPPIAPTPPPAPLPPGISVRVAKALGSRGHNKLRVSLIRQTGLLDASNGTDTNTSWDYSEQFVHRWTDMHLSTKIVEVEPGVPKNFSLDGFDVELNIKKKTEGTVGLLIADPCVEQSRWCPYADAWQVETTLQTVLNTMADHGELDYWMNIGDLFYDQTGRVTKRVFSGLHKNVQTAVHGVSFGNHDYWNDGKPSGAVSSDNFGNGLMQWYAQDTMTAKTDPTKPFDFSANPSRYEVAHFSNFFWYNMVGNVAFIGFSGQGSWNDQHAYFEEACDWAQQQDPVLLVLLGHWDGDNDGCASGMAAGEVYNAVQSLPGCAAMGSRLKYFEGHTHCNQIMSENTGFMVGAWGMGGCGDFGFHIMDTRGGEETLWYFKMGASGRRLSNWDTVMNCITSNGFSACTQYAEKWMSQSYSQSYLNQTKRVEFV